MVVHPALYSGCMLVDASFVSASEMQGGLRGIVRGYLDDEKFGLSELEFRPK
jgi:hypothetical protein